MSSLLVDAVGVSHRPVREARIISLVPSITELLFDLGLAAQIVGRTHFCIHPEGKVRLIPSLGGTKKIKLDLLSALKPTHVIVNIDENTKAIAEAIRELGIRLIVTHPRCPEDNRPLYHLLGGIFDREAEAEKLTERLQKNLDEIRDAAQHWPARKILYLIWRDPWMTVSRDTYISRMLALVNWHTLPASSPDRYPRIDITDDLITKVTIVLFSTEPYFFTQNHVRSFCMNYTEPDYGATLIDGEMISWYGSRAVEGLDYLQRFAATVHKRTDSD